MSQWSSKFAFLQDLAEVTHGLLPGESDNEDYQNADEMEEFLRLGAGASGDSELWKRPDLSSLKELLSMVKQESSPDSNCEGLDEAPITISKINADAQPFVPDTKETPAEITVDQPKKKPLKQRNIAIQSILQSLKLEEKENLQILVNKPDLKNKSIDNGPILKIGMFKKRLSPKKDDIPHEFKAPSTNLKVKSFVPSEHVVKSVAKKPSIWDGKRGDRPVSSSGKTQANNNPFTNHNMVWTKVDMELRKIDDDNEKALKMLCSLNLKAFEDGIIADRLTTIGLPQHRHDMDKECVVCKVLCASK